MPTVYREAVARGIPCNSVDDIPNCDFFFGSVVSRGDLQIAISTAGESPAVAQRLRREIDEQLPEDLGPWLAQLGELRREVLATHPRGEERRLLLHELAQRQICDSALCSTRQLARTGREAARAVAGNVYLVGAGPGDPELLTVKAVRLIESADVILHDDLVPPAILDLAPPHAVVVNVGKRCGAKTITQEEINALMIEHARAGRSVVRLKSGDPLLFGRAAEEMAALAEAGVPYEIVPGVSAAFAAAAAHRPLAHRSRVGLARHLLHRPSRAVAQPRGAARARRRNARRLHARPRPRLCWPPNGWPKAFPPICPAPSSRAPRNPISRWCTPRSANSATPHPLPRPASSSPAGPCAS